MSRIGKLPISLPKGVTFNFSKENHTVTVKGPKGELKKAFNTKAVSITVEGNIAQVTPLNVKKFDVKIQKDKNSSPIVWNI